VRLASRGQREIDGRVERIEDDELRHALRRRANVIVAQSLMIAVAVTIAAWLLARVVAR
jgi:hypothetical protein